MPVKESKSFLVILYREETMYIPLVDLNAQYASIKVEIDRSISEVLESGQFILGDQVQHFQEEMAGYCGTEYGIGVGSGTEALHLALLACGVGPGDEVITTTFTFIASAEAIIHCGATPVFVDIEPATYNLDWRKVERSITSRTRAIIPVHLYGHPVDMDPLLDLARSCHLKVVEDCAQALGGRYKGRPVGSLGDAGCLSFFPSKNLGAYGDAGMVVCSDEEISQRVDLLRKHGTSSRFLHQEPGFNSRLDSMQAAILRVKLRFLDSWVCRRREKAAIYSQLLAEIPGFGPPVVQPYADHAFNYYTPRVVDHSINRDRLVEHLSAQNIASAVYYPLSMHLQPAFGNLGYRPGDFPHAEAAQQEVISLPIYPEMVRPAQQRVVDAIGQYASRENWEDNVGPHPNALIIDG